MSFSGSLIIRPMAEADLEAVLAIEGASFSNPWRREHFLHELSAPYSFPSVAVCNGVVVGYVCLMSLFEEAQILDIAVDPVHRGQGIALSLMERAMATAKEQGAEVLALEVRVSNLPAIALYERLGFSRCGVRSRYYDGVEDAVLMEKMLKTGTRDRGPELR